VAELADAQVLGAFIWNFEQTPDFIGYVEQTLDFIG